MYAVGSQLMANAAMGCDHKQAEEVIYMFLLAAMWVMLTCCMVNCLIYVTGPMETFIGCCSCMSCVCMFLHIISGSLACLFWCLCFSLNMYIAFHWKVYLVWHRCWFVLQCYSNSESAVQKLLFPNSLYTKVQYRVQNLTSSTIVSVYLLPVHFSTKG